MQIETISKPQRVNTDYLAQCLSVFFEEALPSIQECYSWEMPEPFDQSVMPVGQNDFERNLNLRQKMSEEDKHANEERKAQLAVWYVEKWGRVTARSNNQDKIAAFRKGVHRFALLDPGTLIARGKDRIASWSKVLSYRDYDHWAVYDARVAGSLNAIQIIYGEGLRHRFPGLGTDGASAEAFQNVLKETGNLPRCIPTSLTYELYCRLLREQWLRLPASLRAHAIDWQGLEMTLFHHSRVMFERASGDLHHLDFYRRRVADISAEKRRKRKEYNTRKKEAALG